MVYWPLVQKKKEEEEEEEEDGEEEEEKKKNTRTALNVVSPSTSPSPPTQSSNLDNPSEPALPSCSSSSSSCFASSTTASTSTAVASAMPINTTHNLGPPANTNTATINTSDEDRVYACSHCDCTFNSHIGLVAHLRIHCTETGEPVPGAPIYTRCIRLHCPHCTRTFIYPWVY
nr:unnamed protein product [Spirometra erinaceieuropaei]